MVYGANGASLGTVVLGATVNVPSTAPIMLGGASEGDWQLATKLRAGLAACGVGRIWTRWAKIGCVSSPERMVA
jgi:hypothetical protein